MVASKKEGTPQQLKLRREVEKLEAEIKSLNHDRHRRWIATSSMLVGVLFIITMLSVGAWLRWSGRRVEAIRELSNQQGQLLIEFQKAMSKLQSSLLEYHKNIEQEWGEARVRAEIPRVKAAQMSFFLARDRNLSQEEKLVYVKQSEKYLVKLRKIYFMDNYCDELNRHKPEFLGGKEQPCDDQHLTIYRKLLDAKRQVAGRFSHLAETAKNMEEAHALIDRFIQIEVELMRERLDEMKETMQEARETVRTVWGL